MVSSMIRRMARIGRKPFAKRARWLDEKKLEAS